jgi:hypothetical protein
LAKPVTVYLEIGAKRTFASAVDWPGWSRGARNEDGALEALAAYGPRYAAVVERVAPTFDPPTEARSFNVIECLKGNAGTDFGVPSLGLPADERRMGDAELAKLRDILRACWAAFDRAARAAVGVELRKGPRGGGRDLDKIVAHVIEAEEAYIRALGAKPPKTATQDAVRKAAQLREAIIETLDAKAGGRPVSDPSRVKKLWTPRYFVRRTAWHVLDHAWEIEDRAVRSASRSG